MNRTGIGLVALLGLIALLIGAALPAPASAKAKHRSSYKTQAHVQIAADPPPGRMFIAGIVRSKNPRCKRGRIERFYRIAGGSSELLGTVKTKKNGYGVLPAGRTRRGKYFVKVKKKKLNNGVVCLPTRSRPNGLGGLSSLARLATSSAKQKARRGWKLCGELYWFGPKRPVLFHAKGINCHNAWYRFADLYQSSTESDKDFVLGACSNKGCRLGDYYCHAPSKYSRVCTWGGKNGGHKLRLKVIRRSKRR